MPTNGVLARAVTVAQDRVESLACGSLHPAADAVQGLTLRPGPGTHYL
eukprot:CAMPEP_0175794816 /NCGR_PEP_ID=MMETSP0097-20121207/84158_1 /TAXON_ID=311494 /ORGANISM="Alexandrium monilatum, Strain CCMP3105" /LENGTH=47 /DNA_ID= /DNA_START= /DNA_END= /DNA_ORIENTATION=